MKILLIVPKYTYNSLINKPNYHYIFPIGLSYISAILKKEKFDYDVLNLNHKEGGVEEIIKNKLDEKKYNVVCTGDMALSYPVIEKIINTSKEHSSKPRFILGGAIVTSEPIFMAKNLNFDFGVIGEGEITIVELLRCLEKNKDAKKVDGICWKDENGEVVFTKQREVIKNLDTIPFPDYEGLGFSEYLENMASNDALYGVLDYPRMYILSASRGCPYQCTFCYHSLGPKYRFRSIKNVMKEVNYAMEKFRINSIFVIDDLFAFNKKRLYDFCREMKKIIKKQGDFKWACQIAVNSVDRELLKTMKESGCAWISFGFESYSETVLRSMKKPITPEQINNAVKWCLELQIPIEGGFIFGDSAETKETAKETLNFWKNETHGQLQLGFIQPYPGSVMYERAVNKGVIKDKMKFIKDDISKTNFFNMTDSMSDKEFKELVKTVLKNRIKGIKYTVPLKIIHEKGDRYELEVKCEHCGEINNYKNTYLRNPKYFTMFTLCRYCMKRFYLVSKLYKFTSDYYFQLDFLRRAFLSFRKKRVDKKA